MSVFTDMSDAFNTVVEMARDKGREITEKLRNTNLEEKAGEAFNKIKQAFYDFGYSLASKKNPKQNENSAIETSNPRTQNPSNDALLNTLIEMDNEYRKEQTGVDLSEPDIPYSLGLEEKEYDPKSDETLMEEAVTELLPEYEKNKDKAEEKLEKALNTQYEKEQDTILKEASERTKLESSYQNSLDNHRDNMIFQGLVNSTIASSEKDKIEDAYSYEVNLIDSKYDIAYAKIKNSVAEAQLSYENAIKEYDLNYAADLQVKLSKLKEKEEKRLKEINEYNLAIREKEAKYQAERQKTLKALREERQKALFDEMAREQKMEAEYGIGAEKQAEYARRANMAKTFYSNFSKADVSTLLGEAQNELINLLGIDEYLALNIWNANR